MPSPSDHPRRLIWFCNTESVADHPETLVRLRDEIGLTTIMPESHVCHTSGFAASPEIAARGPFEDWREREDKWPKAAQGIYPPVAGTVSGYDDGPLLSLIDSARQAGIEVWGHFGLWSYGGEVYPEFALTDLQGNSLGREGSQSAWGTGLCPSRRRINEWVVDCLRALVRRYDVDGFCVDHARYPPPANPASLLACGCADCRRESGALGYDFEAMLEGLAELRSGMAAADAVSLLTTAGEAANLWEFLSGFGGGDAARLWFERRAARGGSDGGSQHGVRQRSVRAVHRPAGRPELQRMGRRNRLPDGRELTRWCGGVGHFGDQSGRSLGRGYLRPRAGSGR